MNLNPPAHSPSAQSLPPQFVLNATRLPARLNVEQTAFLLGFLPHDIPILNRAGLLKPLGSPAANAPKYFAAVHVEGIAQSAEWLSKATKAITKHWAEKNAPATRKPALRPCLTESAAAA